jgi:hypothetical protein
MAGLPTADKPLRECAGKFHSKRRPHSSLFDAIHSQLATAAYWNEAQVPHGFIKLGAFNLISIKQAVDGD